MQDVIATHEAHEGDLYFLPAGRLHAIGAGNFLAEIQQTSDITYRVYDFGRKDVHGNPRELHIEQAKDAIDYQVWPEYRSSYDSTQPISQLINCPHFVVHRVVVQVAKQVDFLAVAHGNGESIIASANDAIAFTGFDFEVDDIYKNNVCLLNKDSTDLLELVNAALAKALENDYYSGWYDACKVYAGVSTLDELGFDENGNKITE